MERDKGLRAREVESTGQCELCAKRRSAPNPKRKSKERHRLSAVGPSGISTNVTYGKLDRGEELEAAAIVRQSGNPALRYPVTKCLRISSSRKGCTAAQKLIVKSGLLAMNSAAS
jgi:hypothetical protein